MKVRLFLREWNRNLQGEKRGEENDAGESSHGASGDLVCEKVEKDERNPGGRLRSKESHAVMETPSGDEAAKGCKESFDSAVIRSRIDLRRSG